MVFIDAGKQRFVFVILVADFTHNLFENIFERHDTRRTAKLIDNHRHVYMLTPKIFEQLINHLAFGNEIGRTQQVPPVKVAAARKIGQQILDINDSLDIVLRAVVDGNARITGFDDELQQ